jgi:hypothetical protein
MDYELERQVLMAERRREVAHLHRLTEARGRKLRRRTTSPSPTPRAVPSFSLRVLRVLHLTT